MTRLLTLGLCALGLALPGCNAQPEHAAPDALDSRLLTKAAADPAMTAALEDQIMVDPSLAEQSNRDAVKPADAPALMSVPPESTGPSAAAQRANGPTLGELAALQTRSKALSGCRQDVRYALSWANRLPADLPLYPRARLEEAAGSDTKTCQLRAVTSTTPAAPRQVMAFYLGQARKTGYAASEERGEGHMLVGGTRPDGAAFVAIITPARGGGTLIDLIVNNGI